MTVAPLLLIAPLAGGMLAAGPSTAAAPVPAHPLRALARTIEVAQHDAARTQAERQRVLRYWTPERMRRAKPLTHLVRRRSPGRAHPAASPRQGRPLTVGPALPLDMAVRHVLAGRTDSVPKIRGKVVTTTGRVFLTLGSYEYYCSAGVVNSKNRDVVVTAGHCLKDGRGAWASKWTFVPGYRDGKRPYGAFSARRMFVAKGWSSSADDSDDIGMVAVNKARGRHIVDAVGGQGIAFGRARPRSAWAFGYPADPPYDGDRLVSCDGRLNRDSSTGDQGMRCGMTEGASGGPWLRSFHRSTGTGTMLSVTSFKYSDQPDVMYGPYFGAQARAVYRKASGV